jgi:hypothetical protein
MEPLHVLDIAWRLILAVVFVMLPGTVFWLAVLGLWATIRRLGHSRPIQELRDRTRLLPTEKGAEP